MSWKRPSAWLPILMSLIALSIVVFHISRFGTAREPDEGTAAHLWQILMALQLPVIGYFALRWLPQNPKAGLLVLGLQLLAGLAAAAPVYYLGL